MIQGINQLSLHGGVFGFKAVPCLGPEVEAFLSDARRSNRTLQGEQDRQRHNLAEVFLLVVFHYCQEGVSVHQITDFLARLSLEGCVAAVIDDRIGSKRHSESGNPEAPTQVDILEEGKEVRIKAAQLQKDFALDQHGSAAGEQDLSRV